MVEILLQSGSDINAVESEGNTALMLAVVCEHTVRTIEYNSVLSSII